MIDLYFAPTPNGWKAAIMLEECGLEYRTTFLSLTDGDQFTPEFLKISPNAKMPAIVDHGPPEAYGSDPVSVFESGAIMIYLAEKAGKFMPADALGRKQALEWLFWQVGNQGPMAGQLSHFVNYASEAAQAYGQKRYRGEYERSLAVLDRWLAGMDFILGDYSVADMIAFPWAFIARPLTSSLDDFPNVAAWRGRIKERPAVQRAIDLGKEKQRHGQTAETNDVLFNQSGDHLKGR